MGLRVGTWTKIPRAEILSAGFLAHSKRTQIQILLEK